MNTIVVKQHTGLGDFLICNGLVRIIAKSNNVILPVPQVYIESVQFMYKDCTNIKCVIHENFNYNEYTNIKIIGYDWTDHPKKYPDENFEQMFYRHAGIDFTCKRTHFKVVRNLEQEDKIFKSLNLKPKDYIVTHEYNTPSTTRVKINRNLLPTKIKQISIGIDVYSNNIFDYITLINNAAEVHVIESSVLCLVDLCQDIKNLNLFCHRYAKQQVIDSGPWMMPKLCKNWKIYLNTNNA